MLDINGFHIMINCVCPLQGRSCAPASSRAVPWTVPSASRLTPTTVRSVSADRGPRSANPLYVTSTVPLDTCTYSHPESTLSAIPMCTEKICGNPGVCTCVCFVAKRGEVWGNTNGVMDVRVQYSSKWILINRFRNSSSKTSRL